MPEPMSLNTESRTGDRGLGRGTKGCVHGGGWGETSVIVSTVKNKEKYFFKRTVAWLAWLSG